MRARPPKSKIKLRDIFLGLQSQMESALTFNRKIMTHPVAKGDASELAWVDMLSIYLPTRYRVDKAFVIDSQGSISEQIDIAIYDHNYCPFFLRQYGATYLPAESIYAVIEVKPTMSLANIKYAAKKAKSVRKLVRTSIDIHEARGKTNAKVAREILAGLVTLEGKCSNSLMDKAKKLKVNEFLDFGCTLSGDSFWFLRNDEGFMHKAKEIKQERGIQKQGLIHFFLRLLSELQKIATVPAMDIEEYIKQYQKN